MTENLLTGILKIAKNLIGIHSTSIFCSSNKNFAESVKPDLLVPKNSLKQPKFFWDNNQF